MKPKVYADCFLLVETWRPNLSRSERKSYKVPAQEVNFWIPRRKRSHWKLKTTLQSFTSLSLIFAISQSWQYFSLELNTIWGELIWSESFMDWIRMAIMQLYKYSTERIGCASSIFPGAYLVSDIFLQINLFVANCH